MNLTLILSCNSRFGIGFVINDVRSLYPMTVTTEPSPPRALVDWWPRSQILLLSVFFPYYRILYDLFWVGIFVTFLWYLCLFKTTARFYCKEKVRELFNFFNVWEVRKNRVREILISRQLVDEREARFLVLWHLVKFLMRNIVCFFLCLIKFALV